MDYFPHHITFHKGSDQTSNSAQKKTILYDKIHNGAACIDYLAHVKCYFFKELKEGIKTATTEIAWRKMFFFHIPRTQTKHRGKMRTQYPIPGLCLWINFLSLDGEDFVKFNCLLFAQVF